MTPSSPHRPQMTAEEFEQVARGAPETVRLEYARGGIGARLPADGDHDEIVMWLLEQFLHHRPDLRLYPGRGLKVDRGQAGRVRPDGVLAPRRHFTGQGEWADPAGVLMVAEVTPGDADGDHRIRADKRAAYAAAGVPVYLVVDRGERSLTVHSEPEEDTYRSSVTRPLGAVIHLPSPVAVSLRTTELELFAH